MAFTCAVFRSGFSVDAFQDTMGLHAFMRFYCFVRRPIYFLLPQIRNKNKISLSFLYKNLAYKEFIYTASMVLIHHFILFH